MGEWYDTTMPWNGQALPYNNTALPWKDPTLPWIIAGLGGAYNPINALGADLLGYWDADSRYWGTNGGITQAGGLVSSWRDAVAGYDAAQGTGSAQPVFSSTSFNGAPGLSFDGTDDCLATATNPFIVGAGPFDVWMVGTNDALAADATNRTIVSFGGSTSATQGQIRRTISGGVNRAQANAGAGAVTTSAADFTGRHYLHGRYTPTTIFISIDGNAESSVAAVPAVASGRLRLGATANTTASSFTQGQITLVMVTNPLDAAKTTNLQTFLQTRRML